MDNGVKRKILVCVGCFPVNFGCQTAITIVHNFSIQEIQFTIRGKKRFGDSTCLCRLQSGHTNHETVGTNSFSILKCLNSPCYPMTTEHWVSWEIVYIYIS